MDKHVIPAKAGISHRKMLPIEIPAFAGMTENGYD